MLKLFGVRFTQRLPEDVLQWLSAMVTPERRQRAARFRQWQDHHRCLLAELLARHALGKILCHPMNTLTFGSSPEGKLFLPGVPDLHFNLSHSGNWVICAVSDWVVGADVEEKKAVYPELISACFDPDEQAEINALAGEAQQKLFYLLWTAKESYAKALGLGLGLDFRQYSMMPLSLEAPKIQAKGLADPAARFWLGEMDDRHAAAVCWMGGEAQPERVNVEMEAFIRALADFKTF